MRKDLPENLDYRKADTADDTPELLIIEGPTWTNVQPWDDLSRELLNTLLREGWRMRRCFAGVRVFSPYLREA